MKLAWIAVGALALSGTAWAQQPPSEFEEEQKEERARERAEEVSEQAASKVESTTEEVAEIVYTERGMLGDGEEVRNTIVTDPIGVILGDGVNAQYYRPISPKVSAVIGGRFARTRLGEGGAATTAGATGGVDFFMLGENNEGLRIGPRIVGNVGTETIGENAVAGSIGAGGELGYNWIAESGVTAGVAGGVNALLGGSVNVDVEGFGEAGINPYGRINIGYSW